MSQKPNLSDLGLDDNEDIDIINQIEEEEDEREERGSLAKMTEFSRNLLNSSGKNSKENDDDIDLDKLLASGMKSDQEMMESENNQNSVVGSTLSQISLGVMDSSLLGKGNSEINMDSSIKFESKINEEDLTEVKETEDTPTPSESQPVQTKETIEGTPQENSEQVQETKAGLDSIPEEKSDDKKEPESHSDNPQTDKMDFIDMNKKQSGIKPNKSDCPEKQKDVQPVTSSQV
jgi:hypothetical protein